MSPRKSAGFTQSVDLAVDVVRSARRSKTVQAREVDGRLRVFIPSWMSAAEETRWVAEMRRRVARQTPRADDVGLRRRAAILARRYDLPEPADIRWSAQQGRRWGSCTPDNASIRVSTRLVGGPGWVLDYVVVHELAHLLVPRHDAAFRALLDRFPRAERAQGFLEAWGLTEDGARPPQEANRMITGLDHVQLAMPPGREKDAEAFYAGVLGIPRVAKPSVLAKRGGCWFEQGTLRVHLGVEEDFRPARKAHPALAVEDLVGLVRTLRGAGYATTAGDGLDGIEQAYVDDPFGNRIELIERAD